MEIGEATSLIELDLRSNQLRTLPKSLLELENLQRLDLRWNHELVIPSWIADLGRKGCIVYC